MDSAGGSPENFLLEKCWLRIMRASFQLQASLARSRSSFYNTFVDALRLCTLDNMRLTVVAQCKAWP